MKKNSIECSNCEVVATHDKTDDPIKISEQTGFTLVGNKWSCPDCTSDHFNTEGC
ncbi:MAG: rubredoxin [Candidatus Thorarchaeota archaeon]